MKKTRVLSCVETGHNLNPLPCPLDRSYLDKGDVSQPRPASVNVPDLSSTIDIPLPVGRKFEHMDGAAGWFSHAVHSAPDERLALGDHIEQLPRATIFRDAFRELVAAVHKASKYELYVGRAGASVRHLLARFQDHQQHRGAQWIRPVIRVSTARLREEDWEKHAIHWVRAREHEGRLCCNNSVADSRGNWPDTDDCVIYVVACDRLSSL